MARTQRARVPSLTEQSYSQIFSLIKQFEPMQPSQPCALMDWDFSPNSPSISATDFIFTPINFAHQSVSLRLSNGSYLRNSRLSLDRFAPSPVVNRSGLMHTINRYCSSYSVSVCATLVLRRTSYLFYSIAAYGALYEILPYDLLH